jgi:hypothetical protein
MRAFDRLAKSVKGQNESMLFEISRASEYRPIDRKSPVVWIYGISLLVSSG